MVNHNRPKHDTAFYHKDSKFDANNDLIEEENRTPYFKMLSLSYNRSMPQASAFFSQNFSLHHSLDHLTTKFPNSKNTLVSSKLLL